MTHTADISVLIVAFRSRDTIRRCLEALAAQTRRPREVLLLENGSPDGERVDPASLPDWVRFVDSDTNLGFAGGNNRLAELAAGDGWLAFLNPDAYPRPDWIEALEVATARYSGFTLFGSTQYSADTPGLLDGAGDVYHAVGLAYRACYRQPVAALPPEGEVFGPCGAAAMIRRDVFDALGGFDEHLFCYNEDVDLAYRARLAGHRAIQLRGAAVDHEGYASSGRRSRFATFYGVRNRAWVFLRNTPGWLLPVLMPLHIAMTMALWLSAARFGQFGLFARALSAALADWRWIWRTRRELQRKRVVPASRLAAAMCWRPGALLRRSPDIRPVDNAGVSSPEVPGP